MTQDQAGDETGRVVTRFIPVPKSVSVEAQQFLGMDLAALAGGTAQEPARDDLDGWRSRIKTTNEGLTAALELRGPSIPVTTSPCSAWRSSRREIGRRPLLACGNSNGDVPMLRFPRVDSRPSLRLLILHDDAAREFDYTAGAEDALARARDRDWTIVSTKTDWNTVFPDDGTEG